MSNNSAEALSPKILGLIKAATLGGELDLEALPYPRPEDPPPAAPFRAPYRYVSRLDLAAMAEQ